MPDASDIDDVASSLAADAVADLVARAAISEVLVRYCTALDTRDLALLRSCFHPSATHDHGGFVGPSMEFCDLAMALLARLVLTQHLLGNISITVTGKTAAVASYFQAYHRMPMVGDMVIPQANPGEDVFIAGRYIDRFEHADGAWRIAHRTGHLDWWRFETASDRGHFGADGATGLVPDAGAKAISP